MKKLKVPIRIVTSDPTKIPTIISYLNITSEDYVRKTTNTIVVYLDVEGLVKVITKKDWENLEIDNSLENFRMERALSFPDHLSSFIKYAYVIRRPELLNSSVNPSI